MKASVSSSVKKFKVSLWVSVYDNDTYKDFSKEPNHIEYYLASTADQAFYGCGLFIGEWKTIMETRDFLAIAQQEERWLMKAVIEYEA